MFILSLRRLGPILKNIYYNTDSLLTDLQYSNLNLFLCYKTLGQREYGA